MRTTQLPPPYLCRPTPGSATAAQSSPSGAASLTSSSYASWCDTALRLWSKTESRVHPLPRDHVSVVRKNVREKPSTVSPTRARASLRQRENHSARSSQWPRAEVACLCACVKLCTQAVAARRKSASSSVNRASNALPKSLDRLYCCILLLYCASTDLAYCSRATHSFSFSSLIV